MKWFWILIAVSCWPWGIAYAQTVSNQNDKDDIFQEEDEFLERESDFPDLVPVDETDEIMDEFLLLQDEGFVYSASKHVQKFSESPSSITVIHRELIENTFCLDLTCLLSMSPEIDVLDITQSYAAVSSRSSTTVFGDKVLLLIDGQEMNQESLGVPFWKNLPIHLDEIERIEIIRGPGSALYGANAQAMVVTIITRSEHKKQAEAFWSAGETNRNSLQMRLGQQWGNWYLQISTGLDSADEWEHAGKIDFLNYRLRLQIEHRNQQANTQVRILLSRYDGSFFTLVAPGYYRQSNDRRFSVIHRQGPFQFMLTAGWMDMNVSLDMPLVLNGVKLGKLADPIPFTNSDIFVEAQWKDSLFENNLSIAAINYRWLAFLSDYNTPDWVNQHRIGIFIHDEHRLWDRLVITGGLRFDYNSITPWALSPRLALVWNMRDQHYLRASFARAFRKPSFFQTSLHIHAVEAEPGFIGLENFFENNIGNSDLENELVTAFELGYSTNFLKGSVQLETTVFFNMYYGFIGFKEDIVFNDLNIPDLEKSSLVTFNDKMNSYVIGGSGSLIWKISPSWRASVNYTITGWSANIHLPTESGIDLINTSWYQKQLANAALLYMPKTGLRLGWFAQVSSGLSYDIKENGGVFDPSVYKETKTQVVISGFLSWRLGFEKVLMEAGMRAFNIFHTKFHDFPATRRIDGGQFGGQTIGRQVSVFCRMVY